MSTAYDVPCVEHRIDVTSIKVVSAHERGRATIVAMCSCEDEYCAWVTNIESSAWISSKWPEIREVAG